jgi:ABC-type dipeptide/oligopeptide/nickel transport system permease subunit
MSLFKKQKYDNESPGRLAWHRFRRNMPAMVALGYVVVLCFVALFAYLIIPDKSPDANRMALQIATQKPGFKVDMLQMQKSSMPYIWPSIFTQAFSGYDDGQLYIPVDTVFVKDKKLVVQEYTGDKNLTITREYTGFDLNGQGPVIGNSYRVLGGQQEPPVISKTFILGTDRYGRDMLSRLILGARVSMLVGIVAVIISLIIGVTLGAIAGYFGGWIDSLIQWFINVIWAIPTILLVIAVSIALGKGFMQVFIAVGLTMWVEVARLVRGQVLSLRQMEFVEASKALGFSHWRAIFVHILPNISGPLAVVAASNFASAILIEAGLSFIGFGVQPPTASWGTMIRDHYGYIILDNAYLAVLPGLAIVSVVLAFIMLGNGLRDAMDVKGVADRA